jgi:hypothetical protein
MNANRILGVPAAMAVALLLSLAAAMTWQKARVLQAHDAHVREQALAAQRLLEAQHRAELYQRAEQVAGDPAFVGYVEQAMGGALPGMTVDTTSIVDLLRERQSQHGLAALAVLDRNGRVVASTMRLSGSGALQDDPLVERTRTDLAATTGVWLRPDSLMHVAVLPLTAVGISEGFLLAGVPLDFEFAQALGSAAGADVSLQRTADARIVVSTLGDSAPAAPVDQAPAAALRAAATASVAVDGVGRPVVSAPLLGSERVRLLMIPFDAPRAALASALRLPSLVAAALLLLAMACGGWWLRRCVLQPVKAIASRLDRAAGGDYHLQFPEHDAGAVVPLATAFNRLMANLRA